jgi:hypothetical protein
MNIEHKYRSSLALFAFFADYIFIILGKGDKATTVEIII